MHKIGLRLALLFFLGVVPAFAQGQMPSPTAEATPPLEVSLGYSYIHTKVIPPVGCCFAMHGGSVSVLGNVNNWLGFVGDFGGYYTSNVMNSGSTLSMYSYTFGPRISFRQRERFTPFIQGLLGGGHAGGTLYTQSFQVGSAPPTPQNSFVMVLGGGLDLNVSRHFAIRAFEADWFFTKFPNGTTNRQNNLRVTAGVVFRFGGR